MLQNNMNISPEGDSSFLCECANTQTMEIKEQISSYWGKRSDSFLEQRRAELHSSVGMRWEQELGKLLKTDKTLNILDVGCGAGFFSILLARQGHRVTGIDLTSEMIACAAQLAKEENADCRFFQMDAEKPDFSDGSFDVVISRNLTWTLPHADKAYAEWYRILKNDGLLLNFDANYGAEDTSDTSNLPSQHSHHKLGMDMLMENEHIKNQIPLSKYMRPAWDIEILRQIGMKTVLVDFDIQQRIYQTYDEFYNVTPIFAIHARK